MTARIIFAVVLNELLPDFKTSLKDRSKIWSSGSFFVLKYYGLIHFNFLIHSILYSAPAGYL